MSSWTVQKDKQMLRMLIAHKRVWNKPTTIAAACIETVGIVNTLSALKL